MLALARLQRKIRLVESPYRTPQTLVGGPRVDAALAASSGRTATTKAMGKGSTQHQHLIQTEVPKKLLEEWLAHVERALRAARPAAGRAPAAARRLRAARARHRRPGRRQGRQRRLRADPGPARPSHPLGARPEHLRRGAAQEAPDDARPPLPDPPLQDRLGALRQPDRRQPLPDREDESARPLLARSTPRSARSSSPTSTPTASPSCSTPTASRSAS